MPPGFDALPDTQLKTSTRHKCRPRGARGAVGTGLQSREPRGPLPTGGARPVAGPSPSRPLLEELSQKISMGRSLSFLSPVRLSSC